MKSEHRDQLVGYTAGGLTSLGLLVQVLQILSTGQTRDVSAPFFILFTIGVTLWLYYGLKRHDLVLIFWNCIGMLLCVTVLMLKVRFG